MLRDVERAWLMQTLEVNAVAPLMLTKALEPFLKLPRKASRRQGQGDSQGGGGSAVPPLPTIVERAPSVVASVSARVGSISDNGLGGWYSYRLSKVRSNKQKRKKNTDAGFYFLPIRLTHVFLSAPQHRHRRRYNHHRNYYHRYQQPSNSHGTPQTLNKHTSGRPEYGHGEHVIGAEAQWRVGGGAAPRLVTTQVAQKPLPID